MHPAEATFTPSARRVLERATQHAAQRNSPTVEPEHLLLALLNDPASLALKTLRALNIAPGQIASLLLPRLPAASPVTATTPALSERAQAAVYDARKEAAHLGHARVDAVHLLMGLLYETEGLAAAVLHELGLSLYDLRQQVMRHPQRLAAPPLPTLRSVLRPSPIFLIPLGALLLLFMILWQDSPLTTAFWRNMYGIADLLQIPLDVVALGWHQFLG